MKIKNLNKTLIVTLTLIAVSLNSPSIYAKTCRNGVGADGDCQSRFEAA